MKKSNIIFFGVFLGLLFPNVVSAASADTPVGTGLTQGICTSKPYQDEMISTTNKSYFSQCMQATCKNNKYDISKYFENKKVNCLNGNSDPYIVLKKNGCSNYEDKVCSGNDVRYCSQVMLYDCNRKSSGATYTTTTKSTTTKTRPKSSTTTTTTTTTTVLSDSRLLSLSLSNGALSFNPDVYDYTVRVDKDINSIVVNAIPVSSDSQVMVTGNTNIVDGSVISVTVKTIDNKYSVYKITVEKNQSDILSNNNRLQSLTVEGYPIPFNSRTLGYSIIINDDVRALNISYELEDEKSFVEIIGNEGLQDGSRVTISVTAEDGSVLDYTIDVKIKKKSNLLSIIFIIIIILAFGAGGFYVYKKFFEGKKGEKYEYE